MISSFPTKRAYNPGGYKSFRFAPADTISVFPSILNSMAQSAVQFYGTGTWLTGYATYETLYYNEQPTTDEGGTFYDIEIGGSVPGDSTELVDLMTLMPRRKYVALITDPAGRIRLVGLPNAPLNFDAVFNSGALRSDQKAYLFKFTAQLLDRSPYYNF